MPISAGSRYGLALRGSSGQSLDLGTGAIRAGDDVRLLGVTISSDLSLEKHVAACTLNMLLLPPSDSSQRLLCRRAFIASRVDYYNTVLDGSPLLLPTGFSVC